MIGVEALDESVYVRYDQDLWHERLPLARVRDTLYVVLSPDYDMFVEDLSEENPDLSGFRQGENGDPPAGLGPTYRSADPPVGRDFALLRAAAIQVATEEQGRLPPERPAEGVRAEAEAPAGAHGHPGEAVPANPFELVQGTVPAAAAVVTQDNLLGAFVQALRQNERGEAVRNRMVGDGGAWILDEPRGNHLIGTAVQVPPGTPTLQGRALVMFQGAPAVVRRLEAGENLDQYVRRRSNELSVDFRTIGVDLSGRPRPFAECIREMQVDPGFKLALRGPHSLPHIALQSANSGRGGFVADHTRWAAESGLRAHDRSIYEDEVLATALQLAVTVDGLNILNSSCFELIGRRRQLLADVHAEDPQNPRWDGWEHYLGIEDRTGGSNISPSLRAHVASELGKVTAIQKEKRKAREAKVPSGKKKGGGKGGADGE